MPSKTLYIPQYHNISEEIYIVLKILFYKYKGKTNMQIQEFQNPIHNYLILDGHS